MRSQSNQQSRDSRTKVYDDDVLYFADLRRHGAGDGIEREVQPRQVVQVADSRPISYGARQIIVAQIQRSDPAKVAVGAIAPVVARIDAPHPTPMRLMIARIRGTVHVPPVIVQPVGTAEQLEERDEGGPIRSSHRHGSKPQVCLGRSHLRQSSTSDPPRKRCKESYGTFGHLSRVRTELRLDAVPFRRSNHATTCLHANMITGSAWGKRGTLFRAP